MDFVFIIDSSRSVRPHDYEKVKAFIKKILEFLDVGPEATRVGLLQYGSVVQNEFFLRDFQRKSDMQKAVDEMIQLASGTMTGLAIEYTMNVAFSEAEGARSPDANVPRMAMVVTDGRPQDTVHEVAASARSAGIEIFAIGVGRVDMTTLLAIGSEPHAEHVFLVANFSQIETLTSVFQSKICGGETTSLFLFLFPFLIITIIMKPLIQDCFFPFELNAGFVTMYCGISLYYVISVSEDVHIWLFITYCRLLHTLFNDEYVINYLQMQGDLLHVAFKLFAT